MPASTSSSIALFATTVNLPPAYVMRGGEGGICDGVNAMGWTSAFWSVDACDGAAELFCGFAEFWAVLACCELARATPPNSNTSVNLSGMARLMVIQPVLYD